ncbi:unnamed protein product, partial [Effrenium voratum]
MATVVVASDLWVEPLYVFQPTCVQLYTRRLSGTSWPASCFASCVRPEKWLASRLTLNERVGLECWISAAEREWCERGSCNPWLATIRLKILQKALMELTVPVALGAPRALTAGAPTRLAAPAARAAPHRGGVGLGVALAPLALAAFERSRRPQ